MAASEYWRPGRLLAASFMTCIINLSVYPRDWPIRGSPVREGGQCMLLTDHAPSRLAEG